MPVSEETMRACVRLLGRRKRLNSSTLRPFLRGDLDHLDLSEAKTIDIVAAVSQVSNVSSLVLRGCLPTATNEKAMALSLVTGKLRHLDLSFNDLLTEDGLRALVRANKQLATLNISYCCSMESLVCLKDLSSLQVLDASCLPRLRKLCRLDSVTTLSVKGCAQLIAIDAGSHLRQLNVSRCPMLQCLPRSMPKLTALIFQETEGITKLPVDCLSLHMLDMSKVSSWTSLENLKQLTSLRHVVLDDCVNIENLDFLPLDSLSHLSLNGVRVRLSMDGNLKQLTRLSLAHCVDANDDSVGTIVERCQSTLQYLDISWTAVTDRLLLQWCVDNSVLKVLRAYGCHLSPKVLRQLPSSMTVYATFD